MKSPDPEIIRHPGYAFLVLESDQWALELPCEETQQRKRALELCIVSRCRRTVRANHQKRVCSRCTMAKFRANNPLRAAWANIRDRARNRGTAFALSFEEFKELVGDFVDLRGRESWQLHLDRIDARRGYEIGNVRVITASENCRKGATEDKWQFENGRAEFEADREAWERIEAAVDNENLPF